MSTHSSTPNNTVNVVTVTEGNQTAVKHVKLVLWGSSLVYYACSKRRICINQKQGNNHNIAWFSLMQEAAVILTHIY